MILKYIYIKDFKKLENFEVNFASDAGFDEVYRDYYGNMNFSVLVGENGVGKTTLMSFIVQLFHNLERYHERIESEFLLKYSIYDKINNEVMYDVQIRKEDKNIFVKIPDNDEEYLLLEWKHIKGGEGNSIRKNYQSHLKNTDITYMELKEYLPSNIITSVFSLHGEYPSKRPDIYYGDRLLESFDITSIYGVDHFKGPSLSRGLAKFLDLYVTKNDLLTNLLEKVNMEFAKVVKVHQFREGDISHDLPSFLDLDDTWIDLDCIEGSGNAIEKLGELVKAEFNKIIYINDLMFQKGDYIIALDNMSSGEKMFFYRIFSILSSIDHNSLVIIEEPELHLNPSWTKQIITMFYLLFNNYNAHFLIATHSYSFINTLFQENIFLIEQEGVSNPSFNTFLSNEREITSKLFNASKELNYTEIKLLEKIKASNSKQLEYIMNYLGESVYKFMVFNELDDSEE